MGLLSGLIGGGYTPPSNPTPPANNGNGNGNGVNNGNGNANGANNGNGNNAVDPTPTETEDAVAAPEENQSSSSATGNSSVGSKAYLYMRDEEDAPVERASVSAGDVTLRDDEVIAVDFVRRAAIAAQAIAKTQEMLDELYADPAEGNVYSLLGGKVDADSSYAQADAASSRYADKVEYKV